MWMWSRRYQIASHNIQSFDIYSWWIIKTRGYTRKNENIDRRGSKISFRRSTREHPSSKCKSLFVPESKSAEIPNSLCAQRGGGGYKTPTFSQFQYWPLVRVWGALQKNDTKICTPVSVSASKIVSLQELIKTMSDYMICLLNIWCGQKSRGLLTWAKSRAPNAAIMPVHVDHLFSCCVIIYQSPLHLPLSECNILILLL